MNFNCEQPRDNPASAGNPATAALAPKADATAAERGSRPMNGEDVGRAGALPVGVPAAESQIAETPSAAQAVGRDRTIEIDGMKGEACVSKVSAALKRIQGAVVYSVALGSARLRLATRDEARSACVAVRLAGFECREARPPATTA